MTSKRVSLSLVGNTHQSAWHKNLFLLSHFLTSFAFMKTFLQLICSILNCLCLCQCSKGQKMKPIDRIAFVNVSLLPMTSDTVFSGQCVLVENKKITAIGKMGSVAIPEGFYQLDCQGLFLMPGLTDMHVHVSDQRDLLKFLSYGVTSVRNMSDVPWWTRAMGFPNILKLRKKQQEQKIIGPNIYTCGFTLDGDPPISPMNLKVTSDALAKKEIDKEKKEGYNALKIYDHLSLDAYRSIVAHAKRAKLPIAGHAPHQVPIEELFKDELQSIEHLSEYIDNKKADYRFPLDQVDGYIRLNKQSGVYNCPTLAIWACLPAEDAWESLSANPKFRALGWHVKWMWKTALPYYYKISYPDKAHYTQHMLSLTMQLTKRLYDEDCPLLIGTDTNIAGTYVGETTLLEMELFVKAGIPIYETLRSATVLPALAMGKGHEAGTIETGKRADFILLKKNPLQDISALHSLSAVYCNGFWLSEADFAIARK